ncbi:hypothetical protein [Sphingobacterium chungjuense]|uniref:hypothetical protein n=1 Tax=Sphingobacterium chungjuense TaxID=2675553 RepID=UPI001407D73C|nr:hypothetical protein [Sphingobacterium chungjuense]
MLKDYRIENNYPRLGYSAIRGIGRISNKTFASLPVVIIFSVFTVGGMLVSCENKSGKNNKIEVMQNNQEQKQEILKAIDLYVEAGRKGDGNIAKPAFASTATMSCLKMKC